MSSSVGKTYDYYNQYERECKRKGIKPKGVRSGFFEHWKEVEQIPEPKNESNDE